MAGVEAKLDRIGVEYFGTFRSIYLNHRYLELRKGTVGYIWEVETFWEGIETLKTHIVTFWRHIASATKIYMKWNAQKDIWEIK